VELRQHDEHYLAMKTERDLERQHKAEDRQREFHERRK
jgi:hypothetical protein